VTLPAGQPRLRCGPEPPRRGGRFWLVLALTFFVILIAAVLVPLIAIGLHNNGVKSPPEPRPTASVPISTP
jgi:hypothetical protein